MDTGSERILVKNGIERDDFLPLLLSRVLSLPLSLSLKFWLESRKYPVEFLHYYPFYHLSLKFLKNTSKEVENYYVTIYMKGYFSFFLLLYFSLSLNFFSILSKKR